MAEADKLLKLWAKKRNNPEVRYPLLFHMLDTAMVAAEMWTKLLQQGTGEYWSEQIGLDQTKWAS